MCIIRYTDAYFYAYDITLYKYKRTAYTVMRPHFKTMKFTSCSCKFCVGWVYFQAQIYPSARNPAQPTLTPNPTL
jgi:hypothetical protein